MRLERSHIAKDFLGAENIAQLNKDRYNDNHWMSWSKLTIAKKSEDIKDDQFEKSHQFNKNFARLFKT